jgi:hypothetical protein
MIMALDSILSTAKEQKGEEYRRHEIVYNHDLTQQRMN